MKRENFDFLIFNIVVTVRDIQLARRHGTADNTSMKSVLLHLSTYCSSPDGSRIFPGVELLVEKTGFSRRAVLYALAALIEEGWIIPTHQLRGHTKGYDLVLDKLGLTAEGNQVKRKQFAADAPTPAADDYPEYEDGLPALGGGTSAALASLQARREARKRAKMLEEQVQQ